MTGLKAAWLKDARNALMRPALAAAPAIGERHAGATIIDLHSLYANADRHLPRQLDDYLCQLLEPLP